MEARRQDSTIKVADLDAHVGRGHANRKEEGGDGREQLDLGGDACERKDTRGAQRDDAVKVWRGASANGRCREGVARCKRKGK